MQLQNETALITGSTSGIGRQLAELFLSEGCRVMICSRSSNHVDRALADLQAIYGDKVQGQICDVSDPQSLQHVVEETVKIFGSLRILIANAGISLKYGPISHYPLLLVNSDAHKIFGINVIGTINAIAAVMPQMQKQKYGRIITFSGGGADRPIANMTLYSASKGAVVTFTKCFAEELKEGLDRGDHDIKVNIYQPGMLKTHLTTTIDVVPKWESVEKVTHDTNMALQYMGGEIIESTKKVLPYVMPSCTKNGSEFRGFSLFKLIRGAMKLQKQIKKES